MNQGETITFNFSQPIDEQDPFESEDFYNLMQSYRTAPVSRQSIVTHAYHQVQEFCRQQLEYATLRAKNKMLKDEITRLKKLLAEEKSHTST